MRSPITDKFSTHLKRALHNASSFARESDSQLVEPAHLIVGLIEQRGSLAAEILGKGGVDLGRLKQGTLERVRLQGSGVVPGVKAKTLKLSRNSQRALEKGAITAKKFRHRYIGTEHLLWGILELHDPWLEAQFESYTVDINELRTQVEQVLKSASHFPDITNMFQDPQSTTTEKKEKKTPALDFYATDLTDRVMQQSIDPVIGRKDEISRLVHILLRRTKNNPVLIGEPGVGKTAIVEGLAKKIVEGDVPDVLAKKRILRLDLSLMVAGTMYRGEFENRIKQVIEEVKQDPNIIVFIDEIHTIVGAGSASGSMDAANILKPALARGEIRCIGATTLDEYRKYIESDQALERRFQPIMVEEPTPDETREILKGLKTHYERFHGVLITPEAIDAAVTFSERYLQEKHMPDKAIDLLDEAASKMKIEKGEKGIVKKLRELEQNVKNWESKKEEAVMKEEFEQALQLKAKEETARKALRIFEETNVKTTSKTARVTKREIAAVVSRITKIPLHDLVVEERERLIHLEEELSRYIVGQDEAIQAIANSIRRSRVGISHANKPIGSFIFLGPSGVGKTETAKMLAKVVFEDETALIRVDMSEFGESFNISKLIGAPAGYVGYNEGNKLTEPVRRKPYAVVLFDEIEKAHPEVFNLLLQVLDDGFLTDATGRRVNFKNTIVIMTSNIGLETLSRAAHMGFDTAAEEAGKLQNEQYKELKSTVLGELKQNFRPEFLNRIDSIVVYKPLTLDSVRKIAQLQLDELSQRLTLQQVTIAYPATVIDFIAKKAFSPEQGARAVRKLIQEHVESEIARLMLEGKAKQRSKLKLRVKGDTIEVTTA